MWGQFKDNSGTIEEVLSRLDNYIQGTLGSLPPWSNNYRHSDSWEGEGWRNDVPNEWIPPIPLANIKADKLQQIDTWTANAITNGFVSSAMGLPHTYDSTKEDQQTLAIMLQASQSADFNDHPIYQGKIPIRAIPEGQTSKVVLQHNAVQMQAVITDMALHIGACKQRGWQLQAAVAAANTPEEINSIEL